MGTSIKYVRFEGEEGSQGKSVHLVFMKSFHVLKAYKGEGLSENQEIFNFPLQPNINIETTLGHQH